MHLLICQRATPAASTFLCALYRRVLPAATALTLPVLRISYRRCRRFTTSPPLFCACLASLMALPAASRISPLRATSRSHYSPSSPLTTPALLYRAPHARYATVYLAAVIFFRLCLICLVDASLFSHAHAAAAHAVNLPCRCGALPPQCRWVAARAAAVITPAAHHRFRDLHRLPAYRSLLSPLPLLGSLLLLSWSPARLNLVLALTHLLALRITLLIWNLSSPVAAHLPVALLPCCLCHARLLRTCCYRRTVPYHCLLPISACYASLRYLHRLTRTAHCLPATACAFRHRRLAARYDATLGFAYLPGGTLVSCARCLRLPFSGRHAYRRCSATRVPAHSTFCLCSFPLHLLRAPPARLEVFLTLRHLRIYRRDSSYRARNTSHNATAAISGQITCC